MLKNLENPTLLSLFAGAGGLDIGLEAAGFTTLVANDLEEYACATLEMNQKLGQMPVTHFDKWFQQQLTQKCYKNITLKEILTLKNRILTGLGKTSYLKNATIIPGDIKKIASYEFLAKTNLKVGDITLVAGGPPCQPFSRAGKRETIKNDKGQLFMEFVRIVNDLKPRWFLFENVKGLLLSKTEVQYYTCKNCSINKPVPVPFAFRDIPAKEQELVCTCGSSNLFFHTVNKADGSLEIILAEFENIGYNCTWKVLNASNFGAPQLRERLFIVGSRDSEQFNWPEGNFGIVAKSKQPQQLSLFNEIIPKTPLISMKDALWAEKHPEFGELDPQKAVLWVKNVVRPHDEPVTWSIERPSPTIGAHQAAKLALAPDGVPPEQLKRQQWHVLGHRQRDFPSVYVKHSYLSDLELLKLQTFPEHWYLFGTRMQRAFQIGNAVPPLLAQTVGKAILEASGYNSLDFSDPMYSFRNAI